MKIILTSIDSSETASEITMRLLENQVAACVQEIKNVKSTYWWNDQIETDEEIILLIKTRSHRVDSAVEIIREVHTYDVPEIAIWDAELLNEDYSTWLKNVVK